MSPSTMVVRDSPRLELGLQDPRVSIHHGLGQSRLELGARLAGPVAFGWSILGRYCIDLLQRDSAPS